jgi:hypothetical protein
MNRFQSVFSARVTMVQYKVSRLLSHVHVGIGAIQPQSICIKRLRGDVKADWEGFKTRLVSAE